jgi:hypothetical protein
VANILRRNRDHLALSACAVIGEVPGGVQRLMANHLAQSGKKE